MNCTETRSLLSQYLDGAINSKKQQAVRGHLAECEACAGEHALLGKTHRIVSSLGRKQPPPHLALRLRVAISREVAVARRPWYIGWSAHLQNAYRAFLVPATAGALSAVIVFGLLIGFFALPAQLQAQNDVPTALYTPPQLRYSTFDLTSGAADDAVVIEALVDANGRVQDYRILSAPHEVHGQLTQLQNGLIFMQFSPATSFGKPISGKAVISFSKIDVTG